ncbi:MAG: hypothetical protein AVDCRST_MAG27-42, partial [uncultured Craurococcus sp.]
GAWLPRVAPCRARPAAGLCVMPRPSPWARLGGRAGREAGERM